MRKPPHSQIEHLDIDALRGGDFEERLFEPPRIDIPPVEAEPADVPSPFSDGDMPPALGDEGPVEDVTSGSALRGLRARWAQARAALADDVTDTDDEAAADSNGERAPARRSRRFGRKGGQVADRPDGSSSSDMSAVDPPALGGDLTDENAGRRLGFSLRMGLRERLRLRKSADAGGKSDDDPFAALLTPLSDYDLDQLRRELEADTVPIYYKVRSAHRAEGFSLRAGIVIGWLVVLSLVFVWRDYFAALSDQAPPSWMQVPAWAQDWPASGDYPQIGMYALGAMAPILLLVLANSAGVEAMRVLVRPSVRAVASFLTLGVIGSVGVILIINFQPVAAVATLLIGNLVGYALGPWYGPRRRRRGR